MNEKLNIPDFNNLTKDKVISMEEKIDNITSEEALKIIENFPDFNKVMSSVLTDYKNIIGDTNISGEGFKSFKEVFTKLTDQIEEKLCNTNMTTEDKLWIIDSMLKVVRITDSRNKDDKKFIIILSTIKAIATQTTATELLYFVSKN